MKIKILIVLACLLTILAVASSTSIAANDKAKEQLKGPGEKAKAPALEKIEFIHYKKDSGKAKPPCNHDGICDPEENPSCPDCKSGEEDPTDPTTSCYAFMGQYGKRYLKWINLPVEYKINPTGGPEDFGFIGTAISVGAQAWDDATSADLFSLEGPTEATYNVLDNVNAICFEDYYDDPDIIGACMVWYNPATKAIVEFDIVFETDYAWGNAGNTNEYELGDINIMDLQNIATHELGHALGLADIYDEAQCSEVTMYGYSTEGETKKRTIEEPDITGIQILYGP